MKAVFVLLAVFATAFAAPAPKGLDDDLNDLLALVPLAEIRSVINQHLETDAEFRSVVNYLKGDDWAELWGLVASKEEVQELKQFLVDAGLDIDSFVAYIHNWIQNADTSSTTNTSDLETLVEEVKNLLPIDDIKELFYDKLENSEEFQEFFGKISSEKAYNLVEEIRKLDEVQRIAAVLLEYGIDLGKVLDFIYGLFGWN